MSRALLVVEQAGPLTSLQDAGRVGYARYGVPLSGPIDRLAFAAAQEAVGGRVGSAAIELALGGVTLRCIEGAVAFAVAGGDFYGDIDGTYIPPWSVAVIRAGERLNVHEGVQGNWAYLAFAGTMACASWLDSKATHLLSNLGGGRLSIGSKVLIENPCANFAPRRFRPWPVKSLASVKIMMGPQDRYFDATALQTFLGSRYTATTTFDRMGMVLNGEPVLPSSIGMPSEAAVRGAIQVNGLGRLTVLFADHQTTGGYPKIAVIVDSDIDRVAQLRAGSQIAFRVVDLAEAIASRAEYAEFCQRFLQHIRASHDATAEPSASQMCVPRPTDGRPRKWSHDETIASSLPVKLPGASLPEEQG